MPLFSNKLADQLRLAQAELEKSRGALRAIDRSMAIIEFTPDGVIVQANDVFLRIMGYTREEVAGKHHRMFCESAYAASPGYGEFWQKLARGEAQTGRQLRLAKGGRPVWLEASYSPVLDAAGKVSGVIKIASDITRQMQLEQQDKAMRSAIDRSMARIEFDLDGSILDANDNFLAVFGYSLADLKGKHHSVLCDEAYVRSPEYQQLWQKLRQGEFQQGRFRRVGRNGEPIWLQATYNPVLDAAGKPARVVKFASDITRQMRQMQAQAENAQSAVQASESTEQLSIRGSTVLDQAANEISRVADSVRQSSQILAKLGDSSGQIGAIIGTISDIADQTNLLALNAAIEAARAGEMGRGFAVVADEVRKLAERTSQSTGEISGIVKSIQGDSASAIGAMEAMRTLAETTLELAQQAQGSIAEIRSGTRNVVQVVRDVSTLLQQQG
ncbi:PAS domain S-box protein [Chromobacterium paludis]|uniref:PAS domain S-box protein n=2 Tax=Chromobacterium paludis TaxID=2605945 RepID=A0A5C1DD93_9NEIS|nr:PAS domain-containing methyl-accepting chemotaxis protein [Chromobacterium paludis]QEL54721.1 PAS domain S-box protein [Chromobacterium paludis]